MKYPCLHARSHQHGIGQKGYTVDTVNEFPMVCRAAFKIFMSNFVVPKIKNAKPFIDVLRCVSTCGYLNKLPETMANFRTIRYF